MLVFLDLGFLVFHAVLILFNLIGWAWSKTRRLHLLVLTLTYSIIPAGIKFIALPFIWRYPLTEERQVRIRERLERRGVRVSATAGQPT